MNCNFFVPLKSNEIEWDQTRANDIYSIQMRASNITVHKWEKMILKYAIFQDYMRNDRKMPEKWRRKNRKYHSWLLMAHMPFMNWTRLSKTISSSSSVPFCPILFHSFAEILNIDWYFNLSAVFCSLKIILLI